MDAHGVLNNASEGCDLLKTTKGGYSCKPFHYETWKVQGFDKKTPSNIHHHNIVCDDANFYSIGGHTTELTVSLRYEAVGNWVYNYALKAWRKLEGKDIPFPRAPSAVVLTGKLLLVYGVPKLYGQGIVGRMMDSLLRSNDLYMCNLSDTDLKFTRVKGKGVVPPWSGTYSIFLKDNFCYAICCLTYFTDNPDSTIPVPDIYRLNLRTNEWEEIYVHKVNEVTDRKCQKLAVVDEKVYVLLERVSEDFVGVNKDYYFEEISVFCLTSRTWCTVVTHPDIIYGYPSPRHDHSIVNIPGTTSFLVTGGFHNREALDDTWRLEIPSMKWMKMGSLRLCTPVFGHASCVTPSGKMYTFGGLRGSFIDFCFKGMVPPEVQSAWICIPKLKDICWEAVTHYYSLSQLPKEKLEKLIPLEYCEKLNLLTYAGFI